MKERYRSAALFITGFLLLNSCLDERQSPRDLVNDPFPETQAELRGIVESVANDIMSANIEGLQAIHLESDKFTKFGPRRFERQDVASTNESEAVHFRSVSNMNYEIEGLKVDVFGDIGVVTYYPHVSFVKDGEEQSGSGRQTLVFLRTEDGWRIVHEHGTMKHQ